MLQLGLFADTASLVKKATSQNELTDKYIYVIFYFLVHRGCFQTTMGYYCNVVECKSHRSKAKKLHIYSFMADMMWVKWRQSSLWREDGRHRFGGKDNTLKNTDMLSLTINSRSALTATQAVIPSTALSLDYLEEATRAGMTRKTHI